MLTFGAIAAKYRPKWLVWENVPGVLSSNGGRDFGTFLGMLGQLGYGFAYRVLDAQYFGVAQRRRRVFVVGYLGDWRRAAAVLFERHSLSGHPAPRREAGKEVAATIRARPTRGGGLRTDFECAGGLQPVTFDRQSSGEYGSAPIASTISARDYKSASDLVGPAMGVHGTQDPDIRIDQAHTLGRNNGQENAVLAFDSMNQSCSEHVTHTLRVGRAADEIPMTLTAMAVCRLTPTECERLQGFPDGWTSGFSESVRYRMLGNAIAVPCSAWIAKRIVEYD